jgi:hypothetical protein
LSYFSHRLCPISLRAARPSRGFAARPFGKSQKRHLENGHFLRYGDHMSTYCAAVASSITIRQGDSAGVHLGARVAPRRPRKCVGLLGQHGPLGQLALVHPKLRADPPPPPGSNRSHVAISVAGNATLGTTARATTLFRRTTYRASPTVAQNRSRQERRHDTRHLTRHTTPDTTPDATHERQATRRLARLAAARRRLKHLTAD